MQKQPNSFKDQSTYFNFPISFWKIILSITCLIGITLSITSAASSAAFWERSDGAKVSKYTIDNPTNIYSHTIAADSTAPISQVDSPNGKVTSLEQSIQWSGSDDVSGSDYASGLQCYDIRYSSDDGQTWIDWQKCTTATSAVFNGEADAVYQFSSRAIDNAGNSEQYPDIADVIVQFPTSTPTPIPVDITAPISQVDSPNGKVTSLEQSIQWSGSDDVSGSDNTSGLHCYDIRYSSDDGQIWVEWQECTTETSAMFNGEADAVYQFSSRAIDNAGNSEQYPDIADVIVQFPTSTPTPTFVPTSTGTSVPTATSVPTMVPTSTHTKTPIPPTVTHTHTLTPISIPTYTATPTNELEGTSDEPNDACQQATTLDVNGIWQEHNFHTAGDIDWVRIDTVAGTEYHIEIVSPFDSRADVEPALYTECNTLPEDQEWGGSFGPGSRLMFEALEDGPVYLRLTNLDDSIYGRDVNYRIFVRTMSEQPQSRALIIVAGRLKRNDPLQGNIHNVTERVYRLFEAEGYEKEDIYYLATDQRFDGYDAPADLEHIELAITQWAMERLEDEGVLTVYIMDHGIENTLYIDGPRNQILTPDQLDEWLTTLESAKRDLKVNVILEACHIGSFITGDANISKAGRVIITSSDTGWLAYASKSGAYFSDYFLTALQQGRNLFDSYFEAENYVSGLYAFQKPWLDANGNGIPNEREDDRIASQRGFAYAGTLSGEDSWPPYIAQAIGPAKIEKGNGILEAEVRDDGRVGDVWAVIYPPSYVPEETRPGELIQETLQTLHLQSAGNDQYRAEYASFDEVGTYRIVIHAEDSEGLLARPRTLEVVVGSRLYLPTIRR